MIVDADAALHEGYCDNAVHVCWPSCYGMWPRFNYIGQAGMTAFASISSHIALAININIKAWPVVDMTSV